MDINAKKYGIWKMFNYHIDQEILNDKLDPTEVMEVLERLLDEKKKFPEFGKDLLEGKGIMIVPEDYNSDTFIDKFGKRTRKLKSTYFYNDDLTSKNFSKVSNKLVPGKKYGVKAIPLLQDGISSERILEYMTANNFLKVGAHGGLLLQETNPEYFTKGKRHLSLDEKDALWEGAGGDRRVPNVRSYSDGDWRFGLGYFEDSWNSSSVLLCFCDLEESSDA